MEVLRRVPHQPDPSNHDFKCCFCRYFQLEGYRWGHCKILNVPVKGNCPACSIAEPFFSLSPPQNDTHKSPSHPEVKA